MFPYGKYGAEIGTSTIITCTKQEGIEEVEEDEKTMNWDKNAFDDGPLVSFFRFCDSEIESFRKTASLDCIYKVYICVFASLKEKSENGCATVSQQAGEPQF